MSMTCDGGGGGVQNKKYSARDHRDFFFSFRLVFSSNRFFVYKFWFLISFGYLVNCYSKKKYVFFIVTNK